MSAETVWYLDSSAIVKLVVDEPESAALIEFTRPVAQLLSSALATTEVLRAVFTLGDSFRVRAQQVLAGIGLVRITDQVLEQAGRMGSAGLRSLDAIHLATAGLFGSDLNGIVTYDSRMSDAATHLGWSVLAPS